MIVTCNESDCPERNGGKCDALERIAANLKKEKQCTCSFGKETAREIGHFLNCPRAKDKTWWQEKHG